MAKDPFYDSVAQFNKIIEDIKEKKFEPIYILTGEETYFSDIIISALIENVLTPDQRDFNQTIAYASDPNINADEIVSLAKRYPIFSDYQLIIVKEAQELKKFDNLELYIDIPAKGTVLALAYSKAIDKRTSFYKKIKQKCCFFESFPIKEWNVAKWIKEYVLKKGISIEDDAANLISEHVGNNLKKIVLEIDKLIKGLPDNSSRITVRDVEINTGVSREFSAFELCRAIGEKNAEKAFKIAHFMGENSKKYPIQLTFGALFFYFSRVLKCYAYYQRDGGTYMSAVSKVVGYGNQQKEYENVMKNHSLIKIMSIINKIKEYDYKSKSNAGGEASESELLIEFISKCLH